MKQSFEELNIVGATMLYRCFDDVQTRCIEDLIKYCGRVLILLDNYDEQAERKVLEYQKQYPKIKIIYSQIPTNDEASTHGEIYQRFMKQELPIREQVLQELHRMNREEKIDLVLFPDSDEHFLNETPKLLTDFWNSDKSLIFTGFINVFNNFKTLSVPSMFSHGRIFKYRPEVSTINSREHCFYYPFMKKDRIKIRNFLIHAAYLTRESRKSRDFHRDPSDRRLKIERLRTKASIYVLKKDVREMTMEQIKKVFKRKPDYSLGDYLDKFNIRY